VGGFHLSGADRHFGGFANRHVAGKIIAFLPVVLFVSVCFALNGESTSLTEEEQAWLGEHPVVPVGYIQTFLPFEYQDSEGRFQGIVADYLTIFEKRLGIRFNPRPYPNREACIDAIKSHQIDVIGAIPRTSGRAKQMLFTESYADIGIVIVARSNVATPLTLDKLKGKRVSVMRGYIEQEYLEYNYPEIKLDLANDSEAGLKKVSEGAVDAYVGNIATTTYIISKTGISNLRVAGTTGIDHDLRFAVRNDWPIFCSILDKALKQVPYKKREAIFQKWVHLEPQPIISNRRLMVWGLAGLGIVCVLLGVFFIWTISLKRVVRRRTLELAHELVERRRGEDEIRKLNDELESRVMVRTAELAVANQELESFCYSISHDLRTPLRSLDGFSQILLETCDVRLDEEGKDCLRRIRSASQRMSQLIDDLLKLARVTRDRMHIATVDLSRLVTMISYEVKKMYPNHRVDIVIEPGLEVQADEVLMEIALRNLLENAWKFTEKKADPKVEFGAETIDGRHAFFVRDNGVGFDMAYVDKLFKPFQRLHVAPEYQGTGIGLATVQRIISRHGGKVWAKGEVNKGATFYFTLE
jgi:signal transduction histidine kinase